MRKEIVQMDKQNTHKLHRITTFSKGIDLDTPQMSFKYTTTEHRQLLKTSGNGELQSLRVILNSLLGQPSGSGPNPVTSVLLQKSYLSYGLITKEDFLIVI